jgi:aspartyl-tRNA(Asn)/glutamyl-tRNA(Gln) amidotransferase subunit A
MKNLTIASIRKGLAEKEFSALEITEAYLKRISEKDKELGAFLAVRDEAARKEAEAVDHAIQKGEGLKELSGVPIALKDNMLLAGERATAGSRILQDYIASYDGFAALKVRSAGGVILGKTNLDEFAMGSSTENSGFHPTKNPHDPSLVPGGSSGGSAASVAADLAVAALGSDTGGSIRQPAAFCGVVGLKPTYGAVSRSGLIAMASSLDQIGPFAKTVEDARLLYNALCGPDPLDATTDPLERRAELLPFEKVKSLKIGIPKEYFVAGLDPEIGARMEEVRKEFENMGIEIKEISLPHTSYALSTYYIIMPAEVSSNLARFDGIRYGGRPAADKLKDIYLNKRGESFGREAKRRIILGTFVLSSGYYDAYYAKAQQVRTLIRNDFDQAFNEVDAIFAPTTPTTAFPFGEKSDDPLAMYLSDIFTIPANLAGIPAISIPARGEGLPVGFQLMSRKFRESDILSLGEYYEKNTA